MNLSSLLQTSGRDFADRVAISCEGREQTYAELLERSSRLANALRDLGLEPGDRVALCGDNGIETAEQLGALGLGNFVRSGLYTHASPESNLFLLQLVDAKALVVQAKHHAALAERLGEAETLDHVIVYDGDAPDGTLSYEEMLAAAAAEAPDVSISPQDPHIIRFSAGTTGKPKGILHTVEGWMGVGDEMRASLPTLDEHDVYLAAGPLTHAATLLLWPTLQTGGRIVVMPAFDPARALELIQDQSVTHLLAVPTMIQVLVNHPQAAECDMSSLRFVVYGASPISERTLVDAIGLWGNIMYQLYGQSECVPASVLSPEHHCPDGDERERRWLRSAGRPTPNARITVVDDDGNPLPTGETGEITINSPGRMQEIWKDPGATAKRLLADGGIRTRDMGHIDEDGFLFLADRKEDMIISGGYNIWPAELENALSSHPAVLEACVVGIPDERWGETPKAVVVLREGEKASEDELIDWTKDKVGSVKKVTSVDFAGELPKTPVGKVLRREIRDPYWQDAESHVAGA